MAGDATDTRAMLWTKYSGSGTLGVQIEAEHGADGLAVASRALTSGQFDRVIGEKNYTVFRADPTRRELTVTFVGVHGEIFERTYDA